MKKLMYLGLGLAMLNLTSCKKGENDPGLSLKGRAGRLSGTWKMVSTTESSTYTWDGNTSSGDFTGDGATYTNISTDSDGDKTTFTGNSTKEFTFEKDGTFTMVTTWTPITVQYSDGDVLTNDSPSTSTTTNEGHWSFLNKSKDAEYKNKERVVLNFTSSTDVDSDADFNMYNGVNVWSGDTDGNMTLFLDKLSSKELIIKSSSTSSYTPNSTDFNSPSSSTYEMESTWEQE